MVKGACQHHIAEFVQPGGLQGVSHLFEHARQVWRRHQAPGLVDDHGPTTPSDLQASKEGAELLQVDVQAEHTTQLAVVRYDGQRHGYTRLLVGEKDVDVAPVQLPTADGTTIPGTHPRIVAIVFGVLYRHDLAL